MKRYYPSVQVFRAVLFLFILAFHVGAPYANFGWAGVEAFFVISAFFLVRKYWGSETVTVKQQLRHRITRLYPPYIAVLIVSALYALLKKTIPFDLATHLLSVQNFHWMLTGYHSAMQPMTAHTWTLSIEVWGGLVWLLLLKYLPKARFKAAMYGLLLLGIIYRILTIHCGASVWIVSLCPLAHFDAFACGSLLAIGFREGKAGRNVCVSGIIGVSGILACIAWMGHLYHISCLEAYQLLSSSKNYLNNWFTGNIYLFISMLAAGIVGLLYLKDERSSGSPGIIANAFVKLGDNSYNLYLFHWPILAVLKLLVHHWAVLLPLSFAASVFAALFFDRLYTFLQKKFSGGK